MAYIFTINYDFLNNSNSILYLLSLNFNLLRELPAPFIVSWTIAVEFKFYLIFPILFLMYKKEGLKFLIGLLCIFLMIIYISKHSPVLYYSMIGNFNYFILGMILAVLSKKINIKLPFFLSYIPFLLIIFSSYYLKHPKVLSYIIIYSIVCSFIFLYIQSDRKLNILYKPLEYLGKISYSFYLFHYVFLIIIRNLKGDTWTSAGYSLIITILFSILTYNVIEKPFMSLRKKY